MNQPIFYVTLIITLYIMYQISNRHSNIYKKKKNCKSIKLRNNFFLITFKKFKISGLVFYWFFGFFLLKKNTSLGIIILLCWRYAYDWTVNTITPLSPLNKNSNSHSARLMPHSIFFKKHPLTSTSKKLVDFDNNQHQLAFSEKKHVVWYVT